MGSLVQAKLNATGHNQPGAGGHSICLGKEHEKEKKNPPQKCCHRRGHKK